MAGGAAGGLICGATLGARVGVSGPAGAATGGRAVSPRASPHIAITAKIRLTIPKEIVRAAFPADCSTML